VQTRVAEAEAILSAARAYVIEAVGTAWEGVCTGAPDLSHVIAQARLAITHGMHEAVRAINLVFHAAGTNALYRTNPLERYFRDIHAAVQHNAAFPAHYESAGRASGLEAALLCGLGPGEPNTGRAGVVWSRRPASSPGGCERGKKGQAR
jgi:alkylation response protein AidB-like acyl-CoA dehydrogenase